MSEILLNLFFAALVVLCPGTRQTPCDCGLALDGPDGESAYINPSMQEALELRFEQPAVGEAVLFYQVESVPPAGVAFEMLDPMGREVCGGMVYLRAGGQSMTLKCQASWETIRLRAGDRLRLGVDAVGVRVVQGRRYFLPVVGAAGGSQ